ncbi:hypothetical protein J4447_02025 [Candidatus Pacearchaeota archaeon]|nr:hypothetical protein [Candidatus Pacearchaeota archaeon]
MADEERSIKLIPRELLEIGFPIARFLSEEEHGAYEDKCGGFGEKGRKSLDISRRGSNLFKVFLLNQMGIKTTSIQDLDSIAFGNPDFLRGTYEDAPAVALRSNGDYYSPNDGIAKGLAKLAGRTEFPDTAVIEGLKVVDDDNSYYGLSLNAGDSFRVFEAPDFNNSNDGRRFKRINPDYSIDFDDEGRKKLHTRDVGLSGVYLYSDLDLNSGDDGLANSDDSGRVLVVSAGGASHEKIDLLISDLKAERDRQRAGVDKKYDDALKAGLEIMKGKRN